MRTQHILLKLSYLFLLSGCMSVGSEYHLPTLSIEKQWIAIKDHNTDPPEQQWWLLMKDSELNSLIQRAYRKNLDIQEAVINVRQARLLRIEEQSHFFPQLGLNATGGRKKISANTGMPVLGTESNIFETSFDASWEIDLFSRNKHIIEANTAYIESVEEQRKALMLSVFAEIARNYAELRGAQEQKNLIQNILCVQQKKEDLLKKLYQIGEMNQSDWDAVQADGEVLKAHLPQLLEKIRGIIYRLALLIGEEPEALIKELTPYIPLVVKENTAIGLRSDLLQRRPDIRAAERNIAVETAKIGVVASDLFPSFSLVGSLGSQSIALDNLWDQASRTWFFGPQVRWSLFNRGNTRTKIERQKEQTKKAWLSYKKVVLSAVNEAETALFFYHQSLKKMQHLQVAVAKAKQVLLLTQARYNMGEDEQLLLLQAQINLFNKENELLQSHTETLTEFVRLYKALGGGWESFAFKKNTD